MSHLLDIQGLYAGYQDSAVIRDVNLHVDECEIVALLGSNGAGKSTTLRTVSGIVQVMRGDVAVLGRSVQRRSASQIARSGVAHVPEGRALFASMTVAEHLRIAAPRKRGHLELATKWFPALEALMGRRAGLLSGGEQQMLAIAQALVSSPKLLMVDEMSLGLAPIVFEGLLAKLGAIARESGCGIVLVEQHVKRALAIADRAYVLSHGEIRIDGKADDLSNNLGLIQESYLGDGLVGR